MESLRQKRESMENIIEAVTAKDDVVLSLTESKSRMKKRQKDIFPSDEFNDDFINSKQFRRFVKRQSNLFSVITFSLFKGLFFGVGLGLSYYLLVQYAKQDVLAQLLALFIQILSK